MPAALLILGVILGIAACGSGPDSSAPAGGRPELTVGTLYAGVGAFAEPSQAQLAGLRFWTDEVNASGGMYVRAWRRRMPVRVVALDDQGSVSTAAQEYLDLVQQRHVDVLVSDYGSLLTSPAVPIAQQNNVYLFDPTATDPNFFTTSIFGNGDSDALMVGDPSDSVLPGELAGAIHKLGVSKIAILYDTSPFAESQSASFQNSLLGEGITPVAVLPVSSPTSNAAGAGGSASIGTTTNYSKQLAALSPLHPGAVVEIGYTQDDISFMRQLAARHASYRVVFTDNAGTALSQLEASVPRCELAGTYTYLAPPLLAYQHVDAGLTTSQFQRQFLAHPGTSGAAAADVADAIPGYTTGLVVQEVLSRAQGRDPGSLQKAALALSGSLHTLDGAFRIDAQGEQIGEQWPVVQLRQTGSGIQPAAVGSGQTPGPSTAAGEATTGCGGAR